MNPQPTHLRGCLRRLLPGIVLLVLSVAGTLFFLELGVRALHMAAPAGSPGWFWSSPDPDTGWSLQPGAAGRWFNSRYEYDVDVRINSQGLRDVERAGIEKPKGIFRILLLGDSYVEGLRAPLEQTFGKVLESRLNETAPSGLRFEVIPAGVSGWGTDQELLWFRQHGAAYQPDLVLLAFFPGNDFENNSETLEVANMGRIMKPFFHLQDGQLALAHHPFDPDLVPKSAKAGIDDETTGADGAAGQPAPAADWMKQHLALYRLAAPMVAEAAPSLARQLAGWGLLDPGQAPDGTPADYIPVAYGVYRQPPAREWQESFELTKRLLAELQAEVGASGAKLAVVSTTAQEQVYPERWQQELDQNPAMQAFSWDTEQPNRVLREIVDQLSLPYLDLLPIFKASRQEAQNQEPLHLSHDGHWTPAGERLAGESIYRFLLDTHLAPSSGAPAS